ncbi:MAG: helix-turn-helix domain-containing protein [Opitutales bacterium]
MDESFFSPEQSLREICEKLNQLRIARRISVQELSEHSGVPSRTLVRFLKGDTASLENFIRVLRALGLEDRLNGLIPDQSHSPMSKLEKLSGNTLRKRSSRANTRRPINKFKWGDES